MAVSIGVVDGLQAVEHDPLSVAQRTLDNPGKIERL
jgi:hypothetical protein